MTAAEQPNVRPVERAREQLEARLVQIVWPGGLGTGRTLQGQYRRERLSSLAEFVQDEILAAIGVAKSEMAQCVAERDQARAEVEHWKHRAWEAGEGFKRSIEGTNRAHAYRRAAEAREVALRERIEALADSPNQPGRWVFPDAEDEPGVWVTDLRAALAAEPTPPAAPHAEDGALCDGCDKVTAGVKATDDGRAQLCKTCRELANRDDAEAWGVEQTKHGEILRCRHCKGVNDWTGHRTDCPVYRAAVARSQAASSPAPVADPSAEDGA